jgi:Protein of unknown function (DUF4229)
VRTLNGMSGRRTHPLAALWVYTLLRILLLAAVFGVLWLVGVRGFLAAIIALLLTLPLSYVLLAGPRQRMAVSVTGRLVQRREHEAELDDELQRAGTADDAADPARREGGTPR